MAKRTRSQRAQKLGSPTSAKIMAVCPFYRTARDRTVTCESPVPGSQVAHIVFGRQETMIKHMRLFCCDGYKTCEIYRAVMDAKYSE